jgi:MFS family permease
MAEAVAPIGETHATPVLAGGQRRYVLWLLMIAYTLSFLDRQVLSILVEPIKHELKVSDAQIGILTGPVFVIFYTFLGIPIAWLADRKSRPVIIAVSLTLWSGFTAVSGLAPNFVLLALARLGVGFGEAGCNPSSHSLIADISPPEQRASGLAFYSLGVPVGTFLGLAVGGLVADAYGWRAAFWVAAVPGLLLAALISLTVKEPRKLPASPLDGLGRSVTQPLQDFSDVIRVLASKPTFWLVATATGFSALVGYAHLYYTSAFFLRCHAHDLDQIAAGFGLKAKGFLGLALGVVTGGGGLAGTLIGGAIADRAVMRDRRAFVSVPAIAAVAAVPFFFIIFLMKDTLPAIALVFIPNLIATIWYGPAYSTAQSVVPPKYRATSAALLLLILNLIGLLFGPTFLGFTSTYLSVQRHMGDAEGLRWAMILTGLFSFVAAALFWLARRTIRQDVVS